LGAQTSRPVTLVDVLTLDRGRDAVAEAVGQAVEKHGQASVVLFDTLTDTHLTTIGQLIGETQLREQKPLFVAGSSAIESALTQHWRTAGSQTPLETDTSTTRSPRHSLEPADRVVVVSGSCSPVTDRQIGWALAEGWAEVPLDTLRLLASDHPDTGIASAAMEVDRELAAGKSVIVHTSRGPSDPRIGATKDASLREGKTIDRLGGMLGEILRNVLQARRLRRVAVVGGDTAGEVARALRLEALQMVAPLAPGAPLCQARSPDPAIDGIEMTFKGGQVGYDDFFTTLLD